MLVHMAGFKLQESSSRPTGFWLLLTQHLKPSDAGKQDRKGSAAAVIIRVIFPHPSNIPEHSNDLPLTTHARLALFVSFSNGFLHRRFFSPTPFILPRAPAASL